MAYEIQDFQQDVVEASRTTPVIVDFWAEWCAPCRILGPTLEKLAGESEGRWKLAKVDTEAFPQEAGRYGVRSIPNVKLFVDGEPVDEFVGALPEDQIRRWLRGALPNGEADAQGAALVEVRENVFQDPVGALERLEAQELPPEAEEEAEALRVLARLMQRLEEPGELEELPAGRLYLEGIRRLRGGEFDPALGAFIEAVKKDRTLDDDGPRRACVALFHYLGGDDPVVRRRRSELAGALYA